jgi:alkylation response protein AidB-like acyl-CoA dehydrogenase
MDMLPSTEQDEIITASAAFLRDRMSVTSTRERFELTLAYDPAAWAEAAELGWFCLGLPEAQGGLGAGLADEALLFREIGRGLAPGPFVSTVLAARVAAFGGRPDLAEAIAAGQPVGLVVADTDSPITADGLVHGSLQLLDGDEGLVLLATATTAVLIEVADLTDVTSVPCTDPIVRLRRATANNVTPVCSVDASVDPIELRGHVLAAAVLAGVIEAARDTAVEYAKVRVQFDKPIGVHQAIKHPCAQMAIHAQLAGAQSLFAALAIDEGRPDAEFQALSAHVTAAEAAESAASAALQIHGGMGFTYEHDCQLFVKRTLVFSQLFGGIRPQLTRLLALPAAS